MPYVMDDLLGRALAQCSGRHPARFLVAIEFVGPGDVFLDFYWADNTIYLSAKIMNAIRSANGTINPFRELIIVDTTTNDCLSCDIQFCVESRP